MTRLIYGTRAPSSPRAVRDTDYKSKMMSRMMTIKRRTPPPMYIHNLLSMRVAQGLLSTRFANEINTLATATRPAFQTPRPEPMASARVVV